MPGPYVPPGQSPPFQVVDDQHHGAWIIITVALCLVLSIVSFLIRLYVRLALNPPFSGDDWVSLGATVIAIIQASLVFGACAEGLGTTIALLVERQVHNIQKLLVVSDILYLITLYTTKCCVVGIYLRLTPQKLHNFLSRGTLVLCTLWVIPAILILTINCGFNGPWRGPEGQCTNQVARWQFIVALDIATEIIIFGLAVLLLAGLQMPLKRKITIASAFFFRLPMMVFAVLHINYLQRNINSNDPTFDSVVSIIWAQVELHFSLVACSVFCLRPFMAAVSTNYGTAGDSTLGSSLDASKQKSGNSNHNSSDLASGTRGTGKQTIAYGAMETDFGAMKRPRGQSTKAIADDEIELVEPQGGASVGANRSDESTKMIIRKDVQYTVEYDEEGLRPGNESKYWDRYTETQKP
ncbi:hypothetical protein BJX63DRAFT_434984 [Aspergillus granulosus]|uniref:Rhodopsin domain-containing protein n=1 Tax=Aspergillus granulosus TaxID=176169 RepID=A0ABR4H2P8_9EURO